MSLFKSAATISALTLASRITGVIRDMLIARYFGATAATDAFYVAFRLPNMLRRLFAEGAFQQAFVPMLSDVHANSSPEAEKRFIDHVFTVLAAAVLLASVLGVLAAPLLVWLIASGLRETPEAFDLAAALTRVMFPYIAFMSLVALAASILLRPRRFCSISPLLSARWCSRRDLKNPFGRLPPPLCSGAYCSWLLRYLHWRGLAYSCVRALLKRASATQPCGAYSL